MSQDDLCWNCRDNCSRKYLSIDLIAVLRRFQEYFPYTTAASITVAGNQAEAGGTQRPPQVDRRPSHLLWDRSWTWTQSHYIGERILCHSHLRATNGCHDDGYISATPNILQYVKEHDCNFSQQHRADEFSMNVFQIYSRLKTVIYTCDR